MKMDSEDLARLVEAVEGLRREIGRLGERVASLEAAAGAAPTAATPERPKPIASATTPEPIAARPEAPAPAISEELVIVIGAAIAAFLGKRAHIRQIRLIGTGAWAQQGRVLIQASHALSVHSARSQH